MILLFMLSGFDDDRLLNSLKGNGFYYLFREFFSIFVFFEFWNEKLIFI